MITNINCTTALGEAITLSLDPAQSQYVVKDIDGLGPVKANIATTNYVTKDGAIFQNARNGQRNIIITLGFSADYTTTEDPYGELRRGLYPYLAPKTEITMQIESTNFETVEIKGWVEFFEPEIFSKDPGARISIICPDPYFNSLVNVVGTRNGVGSFTVDNPGNVESGFTLLIDGFTSVTYPLIFKRTAPSVDIMEYKGGLYAQGNLLSLYFVTHQGFKSAEIGFPDTEPVFVPFDPFAPFPGQAVLGFVNGWATVLPGLNTFELVLPDLLYGPAITTLFFKPRYIGL